MSAYVVACTDAQMHILSVTLFEVQTLVDSKAEAETEAVAGQTRHEVRCFSSICLVPFVPSRVVFSHGVSSTRLRDREGNGRRATLAENASSQCVPYNGY